MIFPFSGSCFLSLCISLTRAFQWINENSPKSFSVLPDTLLKAYVDEFNSDDEELVSQEFNNAHAFDFLKENIPYFECPDPAIQKTYYFRWWTFRKHLKQIASTTKTPYIFTEFLPTVPWAGINNSISCAAGHHMREGRWLRNATFMDSYARFWAREGNPRQYSFWFAHSVREISLVTGKTKLLRELLPSLIANFEIMRTTNFAESTVGLYMNTDNRDGMEGSIGGVSVKGNARGFRPTLNSYEYGEALALARIIELVGGDKNRQQYFMSEARRLKELIEQLLWDPKSKFFKVLPVRGTSLVDVRELLGYTPWYFNMPSPDKLEAWKQLMDPSGFFAPFGLTTAEQRHPKFQIEYSTAHECLWNGPSWPYATSITLTALANVLNTYTQPYVTKEDYFKLLHIYAAAHRRVDETSNRTISWIDENLNPYTGDWISRTLLKKWENGSWSAAKGGKERGKDYNHSTFCDLIISGLVGLRPREGGLLVINPLIPQGQWSYFCLDRVKYHGRMITIIWDETGRKYGRGQGFIILVDGKRVAAAKTLTRLRVKLPDIPLPSVPVSLGLSSEQSAATTATVPTAIAATPTAAADADVVQPAVSASLLPSTAVLA